MVIFGSRWPEQTSGLLLHPTSGKCFPSESVTTLLQQGRLFPAKLVLCSGPSQCNNPALSWESFPCYSSALSHFRKSCYSWALLRQKHHAIQQTSLGRFFGEGKIQDSGFLRWETTSNWTGHKVYIGFLWRWSFTWWFGLVDFCAQGLVEFCSLSLQQTQRLVRFQTLVLGSRPRLGIGSSQGQDVFSYLFSSYKDQLLTIHNTILWTGAPGWIERGK